MRVKRIREHLLRKGMARKRGMRKERELVSEKYTRIERKRGEKRKERCKR